MTRNKRPVPMWLYGGLLLFCVAMYSPVVLSVISPHPGPRPESLCLSNVKQLALGELMYAADWNDRLPLGARWMDDIAALWKRGRTDPERVEEIFHCSAVLNTEPRGHGFATNRFLAGTKVAAEPEPEETVLVFESGVLSRNVCTPFIGLPNPPRHQRGNCVARLDGSAGVFSPMYADRFGRDGRMRGQQSRRR